MVSTPSSTATLAHSHRTAASPDGHRNDKARSVPLAARHTGARNLPSKFRTFREMTNFILLNDLHFRDALDGVGRGGSSFLMSGSSYDDKLERLEVRDTE